MSNTEKVEYWGQIDWAKVEKTVFKLQKRIYKASLVGDIRKVRTHIPQVNLSCQ